MTTFQDAIYAPERRVVARVVFSFADPEAVDGATTTLPPGAPISRPEQLLNGRWDTTRRYATYEQGYWRLDGSFVIPPDTGELPQDELGWWSQVLSDEDGEFDPALVLTVTLQDPVTTPGLGIAFDRAADEYAVDFDLDITTTSGTITRQIRDNDQALFALWEELEDVTGIQLVIHKWAHPHRRARVAEIMFGPVEEFGPGKLMSLSHLAEIDPLGMTAPACELTFVVDNSDRRFNLLNPEGLVTYLRERQRMTSQIAVMINGVPEWVDLGVHYLREWQADEGELTASFIARDRLDLLDQGSYSGDFSAGATLEDVALDILQFSGVPSTNYDLPDFLGDISTEGVLKDVTPRQALLYVAQAAQSILMVDREDKIRFVRLPMEPPAVDEIKLDRAFAKPRIEQETPLGSVIVYIYDDTGEIDNQHVEDTGEAGRMIEVRNPLVTSSTVAEAVAQWVVTWSAYRHLYTSEWRGNPVLQPGDAIAIEDDFGGDKTSLIYSHDLRYTGGLRAVTKTRGSW